MEVFSLFLSCVALVGSVGVLCYQIYVFHLLDR